MKSFPALAFLLLCALAILALHDRAQLLTSAATDGAQVRIVDVLSKASQERR